MTLRLATGLLLIAAQTPLVALAQETPKQRATQSAQVWLTLVDGGQYASSWDCASDTFKAALPKSKWAEALQAVRPPLGTLVSRTIKSALFTRSLPGVADGEYVVIQYETQFQHKSSAIETVTSAHDKDGAWRVAGYFIR